MKIKVGYKGWQFVLREFVQEGDNWVCYDIEEKIRIRLWRKPSLLECLEVYANVPVYLVDEDEN